MIKGRNPDDNITIMNATHRRFIDASGKHKESMTIVYKDLETGIKHKEEIENPTYRYYIANEDKRVSYNRMFANETDVHEIEVPYKDLEKDIAKNVGMLDYFYENINNGNARENRKLHTHPDVFNSDMNIEDHYRFRFDKLYKNEYFRPSKAFFDIEADTISMIGDFPEMGECPINAISLICQDQNQVYVFLLRNDKNPLIAEFEAEVNSGNVFKELGDFVINAVGGPDVAKKYKVDNLKFNFLFYDEDKEINLIADLFNAINTFQPDFALAWNMGFDIPYIIERIKNLGYDPAEIISHKDFNHKYAYYFIDERMKSEFAERGDFAAISTYTTFLDQMIHFASRRKNQNKLLSFNLDFVGEVIAKVKKLDYKHITTNISELPYKSYKTFVFYNIMDTIVQQCIEICTEDINYVFNKCLINNTRYPKCHRQTIYLTNRGTKEFYKSGFIIGNNTNKFNQPPSGKFAGAFVADPQKKNDKNKITIYGKPVKVFDNCDDYDYSALYPSILRQWNIASNTQIGKVEIADKVHDKENQARMQAWERSIGFMEDLQSHVWLEFCSRWFNLADYTTLYHEVEEFFTKVCNPTIGLRTYTREGYIIPMTFDNPGLLHEGMIFEDNRRVIEEKYIYPNLEKWKEWRNYATSNPNQHF